MTLYEINAAIGEAIERVLGSVDPETGEVNEADANALEELRAAKDEKLDNIGAYIKNLDAEADALAAESKKLADRAAAKKRHSERLKRYVGDYLLAEETYKYETTRVAYSFRTSTAVEISNESLLPKKYFAKKVEYKPDKKAIKAALDAGQKVRGAEIVKKNNLQIK